MSVILQWPASPSIISDGWGWRIHPVSGVRTFHWGVDLSLGCGAMNRAAADGVVVFSQANGGEGLSVHVDHGDGYLTKYFHASRLLVSKGQRVVRGQALSVTGTTGNSTGCHLHFEVWVGGVNCDPRAILTGNDVVRPAEGGGNAVPAKPTTPLQSVINRLENGMSAIITRNDGKTPWHVLTVGSDPVMLSGAEGMDRDPVEAKDRNVGGVVTAVWGPVVNLNGTDFNTALSVQEKLNKGYYDRLDAELRRRKLA